uniref:WH1 domain-containing protein n=1 Tax=Timema monikensis TaxID=170555 RepID=A0A7R9HRD2_9NEOP|nr:unnamed protein product [Timema monikensis]
MLAVLVSSYCSGNYLVRVRAQVMMRDDSTGGWVPMGGGGLSNVSVRKRALPSSDREREDKCKFEYLIFGKRIADQTVVLSCTIKKDFEYNKVMPTFHHWKTGDKKFGLTFQTAADARAFDKGVRMAVEELLDGLSGSSQLQKYNTEAGDDDVFMAGHAVQMEDSRTLFRILTRKLNRKRLLGLPRHRWKDNDRIDLKELGFNDVDWIELAQDKVERGDSRSSSDSSTRGGSSRHATPPTESHHLHRIQYIARPRERDPSPPDKKDPENYSYVQLTAVHEYIYPVVEERGDSAGSLKKRALDAPIQPPLPSKSCRKKERPRIRCRHCQEEYSEDDNARGSCEYAPDCVRSGINIVACISCAEGVQYHCMADAEGEFAQHPCECAGGDETCCRRWLGLALLSLLFPCLWCYPPLRACHWCGVACGICGGRHRPAS